MTISTAQIKELRASVRHGLVPLYRPAPQTPVEWADENFYLSSESSYQEGRWETLPFQVAILNSMGNDEIRTVNVLKSRGSVTRRCYWQHRPIKSSTSAGISCCCCPPTVRPRAS